MHVSEEVLRCVQPPGWVFRFGGLSRDFLLMCLLSSNTVINPQVCLFCHPWIHDVSGIVVQRKFSHTGRGT